MNLGPLLFAMVMQPVASAQDISPATPEQPPEWHTGHDRPNSLAQRLAGLEEIPENPSTSDSAKVSPGVAPNGDDAGTVDRSNPSIDMAAYLRVSTEAASWRQSHRLSEDEFLHMSGEPGTIVLDARSAEKYRLLHVKGAINLSFPDITIDSLAQALPDKTARVLIYCNNNFTGATGAFPSKLPSASLNLSTFVALYDYGYRNVYELGPTVDLKASKLRFEGADRGSP